MDLEMESPSAANAGAENSGSTPFNIATKQNTLCQCIAENTTALTCKFVEKQLKSNTRRVLAQLAEFKPAKATGCNPMPSQKRCLELFRYDEETGDLIARTSRGGQIAGSICGTDSKGYVQVFVDGAAFRAHRIIFKMAYGREPIGFIDHIDGNKSNNRLANLRDVSPWQNNLNRIAPSTSNTGHLGVFWNVTCEKYSAYITVGNRHVNLGRFERICCAIAARKHAFNLLIGAPSNDNRRAGI